MRRILHILDHYDAEAPDALRLHAERRGLDLDIRRMDRGDPPPVFSERSAGLVLTGGLQMVTDIEALPWMQAEIGLIHAARAADLPVLGICLGGQMLAHALGGVVGPHPEGLCALGCYAARPTPAAAGLIPDGLRPLSGNMQGFSLPPGAELLAEGDLFPVQMFRAGRSIGIQFHPEATAEILLQWNRELASDPILPGQQTEAERCDAFDRHDARVKAWFEDFLDRHFAL